MKQQMGKAGRKRYTRAELNIKVIQSAARLMLISGGSKDCNRGVRAYRDLLITTVRMRRDKLFTALPEATNRDKRQKEVAEWCAAAFGSEHQSSVPQRGIRMLEEAIEAYQSAVVGLPFDEMKAKAHSLVDYVMDRLTGNLAQECGGVGLTLLALCEAAGISAEAEELREIARVKSKPLSHFAQRNQVKNEAGFKLAPAATDEEK